MKIGSRSLCLLVFSFAAAGLVHGQGTPFTYQGRLNTNGASLSGLFDLRLAVFDISGPQVGPTVTNSNVGVTNGLFTTLVDFGGSVFNERNQYLEIGVRPANTAVAFVTLSPRQFLSPAPKANFAYNAGNLQGNPYVTGTPTFGAAGPPFYVNSATTVANLSADLLDGLDSSAFWKLGGNAGTGGLGLGTLDGQPLKLISGNSRVMSLEKKVVVPGAFQSITAVNVLGGSGINTIAPDAIGATVGGGGSLDVDGFLTTPHPNTVLDHFGTVGGGINNTAGSDDNDPGTARAATVSGGENNGASGNHSFVGGGSMNGAYSIWSGIVGGNGNGISDAGYPTLKFRFSDGSCIGGGANNGIAAYFSDFFSPAYDAFNSVIGGGFANTIIGASYAAIPGGQSNVVTGDFGFAAGHRAVANHPGSFVWGDSTDADFASTAANQFSIRAAGGVRLSDSTPNVSFGTTTRQMLNLWGSQYGIGVQSATVYFRTDGASGVNGFSWYKGGVHNDAYANAGGGIELMHLIDGGLYVHGTYNNTSDRNEKENFTAVEPRDVLEKVVVMPITRWNYKHDTATPHLGPVAQDFYAAFNVGPDDKHIATVDESGVALAAIQGLNQKLEERLKAKDDELKQLKNSFEELKRLVLKAAAQTAE